MRVSVFETREKRELSIAHKRGLNEGERKEKMADGGERGGES